MERTRHDVQQVRDPEDFDLAREAAGQLKAILDEIEQSKKDAKRPFDAVEKSINGLATSISTPVKNEQNRILGLLAGYVAKLEAARREVERIEAEARRLAQAEADRKVREAEIAKAKALSDLQEAKDEIERVKLREEAQKRENRLLQEQLAAELALDVEELGKNTEPPRGLVPGGRVDHTYEFELVDVNTTVKHGCWRLLRWELDIMACRDSVRTQLEGIPEMEPSLPGIKITKKLKVSVKAAARIK